MKHLWVIVYLVQSYVISCIKSFLCREDLIFFWVDFFFVPIVIKLNPRCNPIYWGWRVNIDPLHFVKVSQL